MPCGPNSRAMLWATARRPALAAAKWAKPGLPRKLAEAPVKITVPRPSGVKRRADSRPTTIYELTGPQSQDMASMAAEYATALGRPVTYVDAPFDEWRDQELRSRGLPEHVFDHFATMARLHAENRYDRMTNDVEAITGKPALTVREYVESRADLFGKAHR